MKARRSAAVGRFGSWTARFSRKFYKRTALSRDKAALLRRGVRSQLSDAITPDEEIKDPYVLEFLGLEDDYSESELENALIGKLQAFLLELGGDFTFVGRQHRLRVGDEWYRDRSDLDGSADTADLVCLNVRHLNLGPQRGARHAAGERDWSSLDNMRTVRCVSTLSP